ncbi:hypothetical protein [Fimbriimonas ginsengisoli]|uniref:Uncharacterized protein n=1 Tax=Fimbriimonas ginsengisoli Gsoil 348 TaxID=661478 RepID=A0A068NQE5_FIMGI|nr:hypothetical protein [Fimbriimonas ginsengisoli]AIE83834.1 hypothetical protein OP10G_0466 [Fimbriimonas ginsengisoli Gsoil 348]
MSDSPVPEWASFFSPERFAIFVERLERALKNASVRYELDLETGSWKELGDTSGKVYGIVNLAQICNQMPMDDWDSEIEPFLDRIRGAHSEAEVPASFEEVRPILRVRLFAAESVDPSMLVTKQVAPGFITCLAVDLPDKILTVSPERAAGYGVPLEELFDIGFTNVMLTSGVERREFQVSDEAEIVSLSSDDYFVASIALVLTKFLGIEPPYGRLVAVPARHQSLSVSLTKASALGALGPLIHATRGMFRDGPGSISPYVYWVLGDRWERLEVEIGEEGVGVEGPNVFIEEVLRPLLE